MIHSFHTFVEHSGVFFGDLLMLFVMVGGGLAMAGLLVALSVLTFNMIREHNQNSRKDDQS